MPRSLPGPVSDVLSAANADFSETTLRVYRAAWRDLLEWLFSEEPEFAELEDGTLPPVRVIAQYLEDRMDLALSTLTSRRQAIRLVYEELGESNPFSDGRVRKAWREVLKRKNAEPDESMKNRLGDRELSLTDIIERGPDLLQSYIGGKATGSKAARGKVPNPNRERRDFKYLPTTTADSGALTPEQRQLVPEPTYNQLTLRNRALLLVVGTTQISRPAIVGIDIEDIYPPEEEGGPTQVVLYGQDDEPSGLLKLQTGPEVKYCPNRAVAAWILAAKLQAGPLFRSFTPHGTVGESRIRPQTINFAVKKCAREAGLDPEEWSPRALRQQ